MLIAVLQVMNLKLLLITLYDPASTERGRGKSNPYGKGHDTLVRFGEFLQLGVLKLINLALNMEEWL